MAASGPRVLMLNPRFSGLSFFDNAVAGALGARLIQEPLGLITVAAMLPDDWQVRLLDRNCEKVAESDWAWADMVMVGGMLPQQADILQVIRESRERGVPVVVGGPDVTSSPHLYEDADFVVSGEAELVIDDFVAAWKAGEREGSFVAELFKADVTSTPVPRFDLIQFDRYLRIGVQFSRGCPFSCEFCDIIELYGRVPRAKTPEQILRELQALFDLGYRGRVDFVDDNLVGNKKALRALLPHLVDWQRRNDFPFVLSTEASVNIASDDQVLSLMRAANFEYFFVGIESPDPDTLVGTKKKQNTGRDLVESIHKIYAHGMWVYAGFILGFDDEKGRVGAPMARFIEEASIPVCMIGLLFALPNTQLTRRLRQEGRLYVGNEDNDGDAEMGDQCVTGLNFRTARPRREILEDHVEVLERIYGVGAFFRRVRRMVRSLNLSGPEVQGGEKPAAPSGFLRSAFGVTWAELREGVGIGWHIATRHPRLAPHFFGTFLYTLWTNPKAVKVVFHQMLTYLHVGPFSRRVIAAARSQIGALDGGAWVEPPRVPPTDLVELTRASR